MPYSHAGEIGDVWKHLPLCEILLIERPKKYYETNSAYAKYALPQDQLKKYGIFHFWNALNKSQKNEYAYLKIVHALDTMNSRMYYGSPALAMDLLSLESEYYFYDLDMCALEDIKVFSKSAGVAVNVACEDSISSLLVNGKTFGSDDFVFLDPYQPFDTNREGYSFFDVLEKLYQSDAKIALWYGYDDLKGQRAIWNQFCKISNRVRNGKIYLFDVWQSAMTENHCVVNPGVPGCGLALCHLSADSIDTTSEMMNLVGDVYQNVVFRGIRTSLLTQSHII